MVNINRDRQTERHKNRQYIFNRGNIALGGENSFRGSKKILDVVMIIDPPERAIVPKEV